MGTSSKTIHKALLELSELQGGCFTAKQAVSIGYADSVHHYHVNNGDWIKEGRGVYRLAELPIPKRPELAVFSLWSRGREDSPQGVYCMETALEIHEVIAKEGDLVHMAVPTNFRRNSEIPYPLRLYKENIPLCDIEKKPGFLVTTLERTILDIRGKCTNPKILKVIDEFVPSPDRYAEGIPDFRVTEYDDWDCVGPSEGVEEPSAGVPSYNDIINAGED